ncbi:MAG TPA: hypothetical protein VII72_08755 [Myxococcota bacterium]|jgi:hypothetical protein
MLSRTLVALVVWMAVASSALAAVPYTFANGQPADATQVNANFNALVTAIDALNDRVAALESSTPASLVGTYDYFEVKTDVDSLGANSYGIAGGGSSGTVVLNADGTGSINVTSQYRQLVFSDQSLLVGDVGNGGSVSIHSTDVGQNNSPETVSLSMTWALSNGILTVTTGDGDTSFAVAGKILVHGISSTDGEGHNGIALLVRR